MSTRNPSFNPKPAVWSMESLKETYKQRLDGILNKSLTVENIGTFADNALEGLTTLSKEILEKYGTTEALEPANLALPTGEQEDDAFKKLALPNIQEILQRVIEVKDSIDSKKEYLKKYKNTSKETIIPPQDRRQNTMGNSGEGIEDKKLIPRLLTLLYILEANFDIKKEQLKIIEGKVTPDMMRKTPYVRVEIEDLGRIVYICDEEGNASYVFDMEKIEEAGITTEDLDVENKGSMKDLIAKQPGIGARIIQTKHWRTNMARLLENTIPEKLIEENSVTREQSQYPVSEFVKKEKREFLTFYVFQEEVRALYPGNGDIIEWYKKERPNHPSWPSAPKDIYRENGWIGFPELVGKENFKKKTYKSFKEFQEEINTSYPGSGSVVEWYRVERLNHPNWPSTPERIYKNKGWVGYPELVGNENFKKKEYMPFENFKADVRTLYSNEINIAQWYHNEKLEHPDWPYQPDRIYKNFGWLGWTELVGKKPQEFLTFGDFQAEARALYPGKISVSGWYTQEKANHPNWPFSPDKKYKDKGWKGWPELVGRENQMKKEYPSFGVFQTEVRALYPGDVEVQTWYHKERAKHLNWTSQPHIVYKNKGWISWPELVGKEKHRSKSDFLSFEAFQVEVHSLYPGLGSVENWYRKESSKHSNWPSAPYKVYKDKGWKGSWQDIVGKSKSKN